MKIALIPTPAPSFKPITLSITLETAEETKDFRLILRRNVGLPDVLRLDGDQGAANLLATLQLQMRIALDGATSK